MEPDEVLFERIHRYLNRRMTGSEQQAFEARLPTDALLSQELAIQRKAGFQVLGYRQTLNTIRAELSQAGWLWQPSAAQQPTHPTSELLTLKANVGGRRIGWVPYAVAASVLLALSVSWFLYQDNNQALPSISQKPTPPLNNPLAINPSPVNPQPTEPPPQPRSTSASTPDAGEVASSRYDKLVDQYSNPTIRLTPSQPADDERLGATRIDDINDLQLENDTIAIKEGVQLLKKGNAKAAIATLTPATHSTLSDWQANARWFLALAYLKNHQPGQARRELRTLTSGRPNLYTSDARQLAEMLSLIP